MQVRYGLRSVLTLIALLYATLTAAAEVSSPMHWSGDKTFWDRKTNKVELYGHAALHQPGESLTADEIKLDLINRTVDAVGHCIYIAAGTVIYSEEMHFNLDTRSGTIVSGRVSTDTFLLTGERINKLGAKRYQTHRGGYTTCRSCPHSWALYGNDVDMEIGGYAFMKGVTARVNDTPVVWVPYLVVPLKTNRRTGLLFPRFGFTNDGFTFVQPFFWAISRSVDMTIVLGDWAGRGRRAEWEGRYRLSDHSSGQVNFYYLHDAKFPVQMNRWGLNIEQSHEFPFSIKQKLRYVDVSDNLYPNTVGDVPGAGQAVVTSDLILSHATNEVSTYAAVRRFRNIISPENTSNPSRFDPATVQIYPTAVVSMNDRFLFGTPLAAGLGLGVTNFSRSSIFYDRDPFTPVAADAPFRPGIDPIRKATRVAVTPTLYTTLRPWDVFSVVPSFEYRTFFYSFHNDVPNLTRGYLLFRTDFSTQLERIYDTGDVDTPRVKHLFRPTLTYNLIPLVNPADDAEGGGSHPFLQQIHYARERNFSGYNFDNYDIVPIDTSRSYSNYFVPLGHSLSYGFTSQLIRRRGALENLLPGYQRTVELRAGQTYNFRDRQQPFSRLFGTLGLSYDKWNASADYTYTPYLDPYVPHALSTSFTYVIERSTRQGLFAFDRSFNFGYTYQAASANRASNLRAGVTYSLSDYIVPSLSTEFALFQKRMLSLAGYLAFQSPTRCWKLDIGFMRRICPRPDAPDGEGICYDPSIAFDINLTGSSYGGVGTVSQILNR